MPEHAELRIMAKFINEQADGHYFTKMNKSKVTKNKLPFNFKEKFKIKAASRGKEICMTFFEGSTLHQMKLTMGMSGNWGLSKELPKHAHLIFKREDDMFLYLVDPRRFAKWKNGSWSSDRGPDPLGEYITFVENILSNLEKPIFQLPIGEVLLNQRYFNGVGNYLRAEILHRIDQDPHAKAKDVIEKKPELFITIAKVLQEAFNAGGGELLTWKNPNGEKNTFKDWLQCYGKLDSYIDGTKRRMWCASKYVR
jgi:endonuclease VIII-like 1